MALTRATGKQVTVKNSGTGSVVRNVQDKLEEFVSVKDFGAVETDEEVVTGFDGGLYLSTDPRAGAS